MVGRLAALWQRTRDEHVAAQLLFFSDAYASLFPLPLARQGPTFERALAQKDVLLDVLLRAVTRGPEVDAVARLDALVDDASEPRVRSFLDRWAAAGPYGRGPFSARVAMLRAAGSALASIALDADDEATLEDATAHRATIPLRTRALALLRDVYAEPRDVQRRLIFADALQELGEPWGEFIALQCHDDAPSADRQAELLAGSGDAWLGRLRGMVTNVRYARGFPAAGELTTQARSVHFARLAEWRTMTDLLGRGSAYTAIAPRHLARLPALEAASTFLEASPPAPCRGITHLRITDIRSSTGSLAGLVALERDFPDLRRLDVHWSQTATVFEWLQTRPFAQGLDRLGVTAMAQRVLEQVTGLLLAGTRFPRIDMLGHDSFLAREGDRFTLRIGAGTSLYRIGALLERAGVVAPHIVVVQGATAMQLVRELPGTVEIVPG